MLSIRRPTGLALTCAVLTALLGATQPTRTPAVEAGREGRSSRWVDSVRCGPFVVRAEFSLADSRNLLIEIAQLQESLIQYLGIPRASRPIGVYLFRDQSSYARFVKENLPGVPYRRALFVKRQGQGQVFAYRSREFATDLRHECTHALLHAGLPMVPLWLDEGLAEYFEVSPAKRAFDNPHLKNLRWKLLLGNVPRMEDLEGKQEMVDMKQADYRYAWAWVHFMLLGPAEVRQELVRYMADIRAKTPPGLLSQRLALRLASPERSFAAHFKSWKR